MDHVVLVRDDLGVTFIADENDNLKVFPNFDEALAAVERNPVFKVLPYQIVPLDEL